MQFDLNLRILLYKLGQARRENVSAVSGREGDAQASSGAISPLGNQRFGFSDVIERLLGALEVDRALLGEAQAAGGAMKQLDREPLLQP